MIDAYETFQKMLSEALETVRDVNINLSKEQIKITFEGTVIQSLVPENAYIEVDEDTSFVRIIIGKDGD